MSGGFVHANMSDAIDAGDVMLDGAPAVGDGAPNGAAAPRGAPPPPPPPRRKGTVLAPIGGGSEPLSDGDDAAAEEVEAWFGDGSAPLRVAGFPPAAPFKPRGYNRHRGNTEARGSQRLASPGLAVASP